MERESERVKVLILIADSNGCYPVPASKDGAVSILVEHLVKENNKKNLCDMVVVSYYDEEAYRIAKSYDNIKFIWIRVPFIVKILDKISFKLVGLLRKGKAISFKSPFSLIYYIFKCKRIVDNTDADKIVLENNVPLISILKNTKYKGEWYYHFHNVPRISGCKKVMNKTKRFLCVSDFVGKQISSTESAIGKIPIEKIVTLYNSVDLNIFKPINKNDKKIIYFQKKYKIKKNDFIIVFAGRLSREKGADILLKALEKLPNNVKTLIVGSFMHNIDVMTEYQKDLYNLAEKSKGRVIFTGYIKQSDIPYIYNMADVAVLPSIWDEPAGLTNVEAMACGVPVVTTNSGGIPEYVGEEMIVNRDDRIVDNIINSVMELLNSQEKREQLSDYGIKKVKEQFNTEDYIDRFVKAIE